jgi:hypothetical protein
MIEEEPQEQRIPSFETKLEDYDITINFLSRGCIVRVGCKSIAFEDNNEMAAALVEYVNDPIKISKKWREILK